MDGLRHVVEPTVSYVYTPRPDKTPAELPQFDTELPSSRLLPLVFPNYSQIDSIDSQNTIRMGVRNSLQTKREGRVTELLSWSAYTDWRLSPNPGQTTFPDFFSDIEFIPRNWLILTSQFRYDIYGKHWRESNNKITIAPNDVWSWSLGHRYLQDDPLTYGLGNNAFYNTVYYRLNENWGFRTFHQFEGRNGVLQEQQYVIYRDLRSWTTAFVFRLRENTPFGTSNGSTDWTVALMLSLKAFPRYGLGSDKDQPTTLFGY
jgi:LPS-assembly protein